MTHIQFADLLSTSNFSFLKSASHPEELVEQAKKLGYDALALTDECSLAGIVRAHMQAKESGLHLIVGSQFTLANECEFAGQRLALLVKDKTGYGHLCRLITKARTRESKGAYHLTTKDLGDMPPGLLLLIIPSPKSSKTQLTRWITWAVARFTGRVGIAASIHYSGFDSNWLDYLQSLGALYSVPVLPTSDAVMHHRELKPLHDVITAIRVNQCLNKAKASILPNAQRHLLPLHDVAQKFPTAWLENSIQWARQCTFSMDELRYQYPKEITPEQLTPSQYLEQLAWEGACQRFKTEEAAQLPEKIKQQIHYELNLIGELQYEPYFLTVYDIVKFAKSQGILCQGRGSAANSTVCYCLGITEVDPDRTSVLFERFISKERNEPPDIDVDFEHHRREEVIQYIYKKYGRHRAALTATVVVYRPRSALRDAGKALGLESELIDRLAKSQDGMYSRVIEADYVRQAGIDLNDKNIQRCLYFADQLLRFPRHLSQHTGGFVIARDTLTDLVPVENASMPDRSVIQWDKDDLDAMGLLKVDVLALGMLSAIALALKAMQNKPGVPRNLQEIPAEDPVTYQMISKADTIGVFQIESRAQMGMLPRLQPRCFYDLVIQVAIVRPGPIQGGMVHPFLKRRQGHEAVEFPSQALREALERTEGVPIFQEQVMQIAILAAGFTPGEADQLRRGMAAWKRKGGLHHFHERVVGGMVERGYQRDFAENIFKQIEGFGEYGFPESHAASFALLVYVSSWLKCHHPDAFLCGLLNAQPMGFYQPAQLIRDATKHGVRVLPVDVQYSREHSQLETHSEANGLHAVRLGLNRVRGLSHDATLRIAQQSSAKLFDSVEDLAQRAQLNKKDLLALADANALESVAGHRRQAAWATSGLHYSRDLLQNTRTREHNIELQKPHQLEDMLADYRSTGASLKHHPIEFLRPQLIKQNIQPISILMSYPDRRLARACGLVTHRQKPATAKGTLFLTLEDETAQVNVIVWPDMARENRQLLRNAQIMAVFGVWQKEGNVHNLIAKRVVDYTPLLGDIQLKSRDFH